MSRFAWAVVLGLVIGSLGLGVRLSWGRSFMKDWKQWLAKEEEKEKLKQLHPEPPLPDQAARVRSAVATLKDMCAYMAKEHVTAKEFAERFGTVTTVLDSGHVYFQPHEPLLRNTSDDQLEADIPTGPEFYRVHLHPDQEHLLTLADLEPILGTPYAFDPAEFFVDVWFPWEPQGEGRMRCRITATLKYGEEGAYDDKTNRLSPEVERTLVHLRSFTLQRGVIEQKSHVLSAEPKARPQTPPLHSEARR